MKLDILLPEFLYQESNSMLMESNLQVSPKPGHPDGDSDMRSVSELNSVLVATIQEAKSKISQIEYIYCSQLYPTFQLRSWSLQKMYLEAKKAAEDTYKVKQRDLMLEIKKLQSEKELILEENHLLKLDKVGHMSLESQSFDCLKNLQEELKQKTLEINQGKEAQQNLQKLLAAKASLLCSYERTMKDFEEEKASLVKKQKNLEDEAKELKLELMRKSMEVDELMNLQNKQLQINQSNVFLLEQKEMRLQDFEEKANQDISKLENMENKINDLLWQLRERSEEVDNGKQLQRNLLEKIEFQTSEMRNSEETLKNYEKQSRELADKVESLISRVGVLQEELGKKTHELDEERKVQQQLLQKCDLVNREKIKREKEIEESEEERKQLCNKLRGLEEKVESLQRSLCNRTKESSEGMELHGMLLRQIGIKDSKLLSEKRKRKDVASAYKRLKSQYNFLCKKYDIIVETAGPLDQIEKESKMIRHNPASATDEIKSNASKSVVVAGRVTIPEGEKETENENKRETSIQGTNAVSSSTSRILTVSKCVDGLKSCPPVRAKQSTSRWIDTRAHQSHVRSDSHDDFLDTPLQSLRKNLGKIMKEYIPDVSKTGQMAMNPGTCNDKSLNMHADSCLQKPEISPDRYTTSGFKYIEPVREKSERENLKGFECKQCKNFYDAILPDVEKDTDVIKQNPYCEHQNGVSRHRYRYAPPSTPDGFWDIGFESDVNRK